MANFESALSKTLSFEKGYQLSFVNGVCKYAGISRLRAPFWEGWRYTDRGEAPPETKVRDYYYHGVWRALWCNLIQDKTIAWLLFDFAVTAGNKVAVTALQGYLGIEPTGAMGCTTFEMLDCTDEQELILALVLERVRHCLAQGGLDNKKLQCIARALSAI